jgi:hypothetical protein
MGQKPRLIIKGWIVKARETITNFQSARRLRLWLPNYCRNFSAVAQIPQRLEKALQVPPEDKRPPASMTPAGPFVACAIEPQRATQRV